MSTIGNGLSIATNMISNAQYKADTAAQNIAQMPLQNQEVGGVEQRSSGNLFNAVLSPKPTQVENELVNLKQAEIQAGAGAKVLETYEKTIGRFLDTEA